MTKYQGKSVNDNLVMGMARVINSDSSLFPVNKDKIDENQIESEVSRFDLARVEVIKDFDKLIAGLDKTSEQEIISVFEVYKLLLEDQGIIALIQNNIREQRHTAEYSIECATKEYAEKIASLPDEKIASRSVDIIQVYRRVINSLQNRSEDNCLQDSQPRIIVAKDLSAADIVSIGKDNILGIVTKEGSVASHAALIMNSMNIPGIVGVKDLELDDIDADVFVIIDGENEEVYIKPTEDTIRSCQNRIDAITKDKEKLMKVNIPQAITKDGKIIKVYANLASLDELDIIVQNQADGIGLVRTEFLYMNQENSLLLDEDKQVEIYSRIAEKMQDKEVIIRILDIGSDKPLSGLDIQKEHNPALGLRGIRFLFAHPEIFETQIRALLRATYSHPNIKIKYPMIISTEEVLKIQEFIKTVAGKLEEEGVPFAYPKQGVMIETPASVLIAEDLAKLVDFFSIGTNDLIQYTLATDRLMAGDANGGDYYMPHHPAIIKQIKMAVKAAHGAGITVGICGELAADQSLLNNWIDLGVDEISVTPSKVYKIKKTVCEL